MLLCAQDLEHPTLDVIAAKESVVVVLLAAVQMNHQLGMRPRECRSDLVQARECTVVALAEYPLCGRRQSNDPPSGPGAPNRSKSAPTRDFEERCLRNGMFRGNRRCTIAQWSGVAAPNHSLGARPWRLRTRGTRNESARFACAIANGHSARAWAEVVIVEYRFSDRPVGQSPTPIAELTK